ncbi:MAG: hypothetical protein ACI97P_001508 [Arcticibacterium sp.]|jgi:hypothetical protein
MAAIAKSTTAWFSRFNLHIIVNDKGEILSFIITQNNIDDQSP